MPFREAPPIRQVLLDPRGEQGHADGVGDEVAEGRHAVESAAARHAGDRHGVGGVAGGEETVGRVAVRVGEAASHDAGGFRGDVGAEIPRVSPAAAGLVTGRAVHGEIGAGADFQR